MTRKTLKGTEGGHGIHLVWGGDVFTRGHEVLVSTREDIDSGNYVNGPALRDALLEAFPLKEQAPSGAAGRLADWEKEPLAGVKPDVVPGMAFKDKGDGLRVALSDDSWYVVSTGTTWSRAVLGRGCEPWSLGNAVVFDPRGAVALPNPLGIRVGDRVERTKNGITVAFEVGHIDGSCGHLYAKGADVFDVGYNPKGFTVTSREVPDRLPAGTITRVKVNGILCLRLEQGFINLRYNETHPEADFATIGASMENGLKMDTLEVIYLPES